ncbi:hypothetical protein [Haladaptatus sp. NG-SE-30]
MILNKTIDLRQNEINVEQTADTVNVVLFFDAGVKLQINKSDILKTADVFAHNKVDYNDANYIIARLQEMIVLGD